MDRLAMDTWLLVALFVTGAPVLTARAVTTDDARRLTRMEAHVAAPTWSPDGRELAFMYTPARTGYDIAVMAPDGSSFRRMTNHGGWEWGPRWSPDGTQIMYITDRRDAPGIYVARRMGAAAHSRVTDDGGWYDLGGWSPDGTRIVVATEAEVFAGRFPDIEIVTMDLNGENRVNVTHHPANDSSPSWSPDGSKIAFTSDRDGDGTVYSDQQIYVMDADGENQTRLTYDVRIARGQVSWSPDGARIAFTSLRARDDEWQERVSIMYADGSGRIDLTAGSANDRSPTWSPDGSSIAFVSDRDAPLVYDKVLPGWVPAFTEIYMLDVSNVTSVRPRESKLDLWARLKAAASADDKEGRR